MKVFFQNLWGKMTLGFHKVGFWFLIVLLCGAFLGAWGMRYHQRAQIDDAILLGGFVYDKTVYNITQRVK